MIFIGRNRQPPPVQPHLDPIVVRQYHSAAWHLTTRFIWDDREFLSFLDYFAGCVRKDLEADIQKNPCSTFANNGHVTPFPFYYFDEKGKRAPTFQHIRLETVELKNLLLLEIPIATEWLAELLHINHQDKPQIFVYQPLQIALALDKKRQIKDSAFAAILDLSPLFLRVWSNGYHWLSNRLDPILNGQIPDFRIALLYEAAQCREKILKKLEPKEEEM